MLIKTSTSVLELFLVWFHSTAVKTEPYSCRMIPSLSASHLLWDEFGSWVGANHVGGIKNYLPVPEQEKLLTHENCHKNRNKRGDWQLYRFWKSTQRDYNCYRCTFCAVAECCTHCIWETPGGNLFKPGADIQVNSWMIWLNSSG